MDRYSRQIIYPPIGPAGQERLAAGRVAVVGCGALGTAVAAALARAGVGFIRLIDRDYVELSNLQRQSLFDEHDAAEGRAKAVAAADHLRRINSSIAVEPVVADLAADNAERLVRDVDVVADGLDTLESRYILNDARVKLGEPWVYTAAIGGHGVLMPIVPRRTPCLRCLHPDPPGPGEVDTCDTAGVLGPVPVVLGARAAVEIVKLLVGAVDQLSPGLLWLDAWNNVEQRTPFTQPVADCITCGQRRFEFLDGTHPRPAVALCGRDAVQVRPASGSVVDLADLAARLAPIAAVRLGDQLLRITADGHDLTLFPDGRAIVKGTSDLGLARGLYARLIGH